MSEEAKAKAAATKAANRLPIGVAPEQHEKDLALLERVKAELGMCRS